MGKRKGRVVMSSKPEAVTENESGNRCMFVAAKVDNVPYAVFRYDDRVVVRDVAAVADNEEDGQKFTLGKRSWEFPEHIGDHEVVASAHAKRTKLDLRRRKQGKGAW